MKMPSQLRSLSLILALALLICLAACGEPAAEAESPSAPELSAPVASHQPEEIIPDMPENRRDVSVSPRRGRNADTPLTLSTGQLSGVFSPFYALSPYDADAVSPTQLPLIAVSGDGEPTAGVNENCLALELDTTVNEDGSAEYRFILKNGLCFSDGKPITAQDLIFTLYVLCDPLYTGSSELSSLDIRGLEEYRTQTTTELYNEYAARAKLIFSAGLDSNGSVPEIGGLSESQITAFWRYIDDAGLIFTQEIIDYACMNFCTYLSDYFPGYDLELLCEVESLRTAFSMTLWGFGSYDPDTGLFTDYFGNSYSMGGTELTAELFWDNIFGCYGYDFTDAGVNYESAGRSFEQIITELYIRGEAGGGGSGAISGINSGTLVCEDGVSREFVTLTLDTLDNAAIYSMAVSVAPQHYYTEEFEGETDAHGVAFSDPAFISALHAKDARPLGAGPYIFESYDGSSALYTANDSFCLGSPGIAALKFLQLDDGAELGALKAGLVHFAMPAASVSLLNDISLGDNGCQDLSFVLTDSSGYGYVGIQAQAIPELEVRQAIACAMNTQLIFDDYFGALATENHVVMPESLWACPDETQALFTYDGTGQRSKELFLSAGYVYDELTHLMYYPEGHPKAGLQVRLTLTIPAAHVDEHPAGSMFMEAREVLESIGVEVLIDCVPDLSTRLASAYESGLQVWAAAWSPGSADADMFAAWCSDPELNQSSAADRTGLYYLYENGDEATRARLAELNSLVIEARETQDTDARRELYAKALPIAGELAVEIPTYLRRSLYVYNSSLINSGSLPDESRLGPFAGPLSAIWALEFN